MSFWAQSTGESATDNVEKEFDAGGGFITIPDGSTVLAFINDAGWDGDEGARYINLQWKVEKPEAVAGAVVFQKLWVSDADPNAKSPDKKRDKALKMLATIDANAGGKLAARGEAPTDDSLTLALKNSQMAITCKIWELTGDQGQTLSGNWIAAVAPKTKELKLTADPIKQGQEMAKSVEDGDFVPF